MEKEQLKKIFVFLEEKEKQNKEVYRYKIEKSTDISEFVSSSNSCSPTSISAVLSLALRRSYTSYANLIIKS